MRRKQNQFSIFRSFEQFSHALLTMKVTTFSFSLNNSSIVQQQYSSNPAWKTAYCVCRENQNNILITFCECFCILRDHTTTPTTMAEEQHFSILAIGLTISRNIFKRERECINIYIVLFSSCNFNLYFSQINFVICVNLVQYNKNSKGENKVA